MMTEQDKTGFAKEDINNKFAHWKSPLDRQHVLSYRESYVKYAIYVCICGACVGGPKSKM